MMDTSKEYIKMCNESEIQKYWKFEVGDYVFRRDKKDIKIICEGCYDVFDVVAINDLSRQDLILLPKQDQLQSMIDFMQHDKFYYAINDEEYSSWIVDKKRIPRFNVRSYEQLWLAFVMKEKYNKVWNGKEWINEH